MYAGFTRTFLLFIFLLSFIYFFSVIYLNHLYTPHGAQTHDPELKSLMLF